MPERSSHTRCGGALSAFAAEWERGDLARYECAMPFVTELPRLVGEYQIGERWGGESDWTMDSPRDVCKHYGNNGNTGLKEVLRKGGVQGVDRNCNRMWGVDAKFSSSREVAKYLVCWLYSKFQVALHAIRAAALSRLCVAIRIRTELQSSSYASRLRDGLSARGIIEDQYSDAMLA